MRIRYFTCYPHETVYRTTRPGYDEGWIGGRWQPVGLSEQDFDHQRTISEAEARKRGAKTDG